MVYKGFTASDIQLAVGISSSETIGNRAGMGMMEWQDLFRVNPSREYLECKRAVSFREAPFGNTFWIASAGLHPLVLRFTHNASPHQYVIKSKPLECMEPQKRLLLCY
eukprot:symbB.v1.2.033111.t1/scaffold4034.1/size45823/3